jgi:hypothetical protein
MEAPHGKYSACTQQDPMRGKPRWDDYDRDESKEREDPERKSQLLHYNQVNPFGPPVWQVFQHIVLYQPVDFRKPHIPMQRSGLCWGKPDLLSLPKSEPSSHAFGYAVLRRCRDSADGTWQAPRILDSGTESQRVAAPSRLDNLTYGI